MVDGGWWDEMVDEMVDEMRWDEMVDHETVDYNIWECKNINFIISSHMSL